MPTLGAGVVGGDGAIIINGGNALKNNDFQDFPGNSSGNATDFHGTPLDFADSRLPFAPRPNVSGLQR